MSQVNKLKKSKFKCAGVLKKPTLTWFVLPPHYTIFIDEFQVKS